jgi:hypothetical protein
MTFEADLKASTSLNRSPSVKGHGATIAFRQKAWIFRTFTNIHPRLPAEATAKYLVAVFKPVAKLGLYCCFV